MSAGKFSIHIWLVILAIRGFWILIDVILIPFVASLLHHVLLR